MKKLSKVELETIKAQYPKGCRVEYLHANIPGSRLTTGDKGTVFMITDTGIIFVDWDNGHSSGIIIGEDIFVKI